MELLKQIKWLKVFGYLYLWYGLVSVGSSESWFEFSKSMVILVIAILAFAAIVFSEE